MISGEPDQGHFFLMPMYTAAGIPTKMNKTINQCQIESEPTEPSRKLHFPLAGLVVCWGQIRLNVRGPENPDLRATYRLATVSVACAVSLGGL